MPYKALSRIAELLFNFCKICPLGRISMYKFCKACPINYCMYIVTEPLRCCQITIDGERKCHFSPLTCKICRHFKKPCVMPNDIKKIVPEILSTVKRLRELYQICSSCPLDAGDCASCKIAREKVKLNERLYELKRACRDVWYMSVVI